VTKHTSKGNCWQAFLACILDVPIEKLAECSTEIASWKFNTDRTLQEEYGSFYIEFPPEQATILPESALVGASVPGPHNRPHVVIAKVQRCIENQPFERFQVEHDPIGFIEPGTVIDPETIVVICKLMK
jgi:hypothetical protein